MNVDRFEPEEMPPKLPSRLAIAGFVLFWTALSSTVDVIGVWGAARQILASGYPHVPGRMLKCDLKVTHGKGTSYHVEVEYAYDVAGIAYRGTVYRHGIGRSSRAFALPLVQTFFPGKPVDVYYNPRDPQDAVLHPGIEDSDLFVAMFMTPFNVIMIGMWTALWAKVRFGKTGGLRPRDDGISLRIAVAGWKPVHAAFTAAAFVSFLLIFVVGFPTGMDPSLSVAGAAWAVILCSAGAAWVWTARTVNRDMCDLVFDRANDTLTLPAIGNRKAPLTLSWSSITSVVVDMHGGSKYSCYVPTAVVTWPDGSHSREALSEPQAWWYANSIAVWVREQIVRKLP
jgi:uncharacterized membrane protein